MLSLLLRFWFFFYKFHLIRSTYSHHPEMLIILLQPLHPLVIHFDYIWCNRFGAHKLIRVSSPLSNCPEWLHFDALVLDCTSSIANALELLQSCTARPSTWCPLCFMPCFFLWFNELILQDYSAISHWFCTCLCVAVAKRHLESWMTAPRKNVCTFHKKGDLQTINV